MVNTERRVWLSFSLLFTVGMPIAIAQDNVLVLRTSQEARKAASEAKVIADRAENTANQAKATATRADSSASQAQNSANQAIEASSQAKTIANAIAETAKKAQANAQNVQDFLDRFWVLLAAVLVFFMQAGFKCLEVGLARRHHGAATGLMNLMNWLILCVVFYCIGFGMMFGHSANGWIGTDLIFPTADAVQSAYKPLGMEFLLFQLAFAATTATIVDGALAERIAILPYFIATCLVGILIYPVFGHWAWNPAGWLKMIGPVYHDVMGDQSTVHRGFHDFAGSTVVHSVGAWIALVGTVFVGRRRFQFNPKVANPAPFEPFNVGYAVLGVIMLWFGWWGFNGGSQLRYDSTIASIILNTNLAGACAGIASYIQVSIEGGASLYEKVIGGVLGGLVAITAGCDVASPAGSMAIGATAGIIHNYSYDYLKWMRVDDVAGAVPVHGACGIWGTLCAGLAIWWGKPDGSPAQMLVQLVGIGVALAYASFISAAIFLLIEQVVGLRVPIAEEDGYQEDPVICEYNGQLYVTVRRSLGAWSRFREFREYMRVVLKHNVGARQVRSHVISAQRDRKVQFIREDDTEATEADLKMALDRYYED